MTENKEVKTQLVLVVDDNPENLQVLGSIVAGEGYDVALAASGFEALQFMTQGTPDLILLDVMMPEMDGYEVCSTLKRNQTTKHLPVIFITAKADTEDLVKGFDVGGVDYVTKPFNATELTVRMRTHLELKRAREEISTLRGLIPVCAYCKKVRVDDGFWEQFEAYVQERTEACFTHGICPECATKLYAQLDEWDEKENASKAENAQREREDEQGEGG